MNLWNIIMSAVAVCAYQNGVDTCMDIPNHGSLASGCSTTGCLTNPFPITIQDAGLNRVYSYTPSTNYTVTLGSTTAGTTACSSTTCFRGFIMTAGIGNITGSFTSVSSASGNGMSLVKQPTDTHVRSMTSCLNGLTHVSNTNVHSVYGTWTSPPAGTGPITFKSVIVVSQGGLNYVSQFVMSETSTPSGVVNNSPSNSNTPTSSETYSISPIGTNSNSPSFTTTGTISSTASPSAIGTNSNSPSFTTTGTISSTASPSPIGTNSNSPSFTTNPSPSSTIIPSWSNSMSITSSSSGTSSITISQSRTASVSPSSSIYLIPNNVVSPNTSPPNTNTNQILIGLAIATIATVGVCAACYIRQLPAKKAKSARNIFYVDIQTPSQITQNPLRRIEPTKLSFDPIPSRF